jgi:hypothetical protein
VDYDRLIELMWRCYEKAGYQPGFYGSIAAVPE